LVSFAHLAVSKSCSWGSVLCGEHGHPDGQRLLSLSQTKRYTAGSASGSDGHRFKLYQSPERLWVLQVHGQALGSTASCHQVPGLRRPCATSTSVLSTQQLPPNFVTAAISQDTATLPARKGTFYPAETGQQLNGEM